MRLLVSLFFVFPLAVAAAYFAHAMFKYSRMISNIFMSLVYRPRLDFAPSPRGEKVTILDSSDKEIPALVIESRRGKRLAIFCHESGATKESWEKYAHFLPPLGYHVLALDYGEPGAEAGENPLSQWPSDREVERLLVAIRWAKKAFPADTKIVLFGVSNGADIAFAASFLDPNISAVVADGLFSMKEIFRDYIRRWAPVLVRPNLFGEKCPEWIVDFFAGLGFRRCQRDARRRFVEVESLLRRKHVPLLMIHGEADDYVPERHQRRLERLAGRRAERFVAGGAGHNEAVRMAPEGYENVVRVFLEKLS